MALAEGIGASESKASTNDGTPQAHVSTIRPYYSTMDARNSKADDTELGEQGTPAHSLWTYLMADVDPAQSTGPLAAFCFMTGYMCVSFFPYNRVDEYLFRVQRCYILLSYLRMVWFSNWQLYTGALSNQIVSTLLIIHFYIASVGSCPSLRRSSGFQRPYLP
jgi:hypothetical protein